MISAIIALAVFSLIFSGCVANQAVPDEEQNISDDQQEEKTDVRTIGTIPEELEYIPDGYTSPAEHQGTLEKLVYETWVLYKRLIPADRG